MTRYVLYLVAVWCGVTGVWLVVSPGGFHTGVPGVAETGPLNTHFFRDVGLAFVVSALALGAGAGLREWRGRGPGSRCCMAGCTLPSRCITGRMAGRVNLSPRCCRG